MTRLKLKLLDRDKNRDKNEIVFLIKYLAHSSCLVLNKVTTEIAKITFKLSIL